MFRDGFYADVREEERTTTSVQYRDGAVEECNTATVKKAFVRVYDGNMWYYASTYRTEEVQDVLDRLYNMATPCAGIADDPVVKRLQANTAVQLKFCNNCVNDVPVEKKRALVAGVYGAAKSQYLKTLLAAYSDRYSLYKFCSSKGADITYDFQLCGYYVSAAMAEGEENFSDIMLNSCDSFDKLSLTEEDVRAFISTMENFLLEAKPVQAGVYPVIPVSYTHLTLPTNSRV